MSPSRPWPIVCFCALLIVTAGLPVLADTTLMLTSQQQTEILSEAAQAYDHGMNLLRQQQDALEDHPDEAQELGAAARAAFATAAERYQLLVDSGVDNGRLRYNLALSYLRAGQYAHAIANLHRARQWMGDSATLRRDLAYARALRDGVSTANLLEPTATFGQQLEQWNNYVSTTTRMQLLGLSWVVLWIFVGLAIFHAPLRPMMRRRGLPIMALLVVLLAASLTFTHWRTPAIAHDAVVVGAQVPMREGGGDNFQTLTTLKAGDELAIMRQQRQWLLVRTSDGREGWVPRQSLDIITYD